MIVGHDWGSTIAADSALLRPDVFTAVGAARRAVRAAGRTRPTDAFAMIGGDEEFYVRYFQEPGRAEAEIEPDVRGVAGGLLRHAVGRHDAGSGDGRSSSSRRAASSPTGS